MISVVTVNWNSYDFLHLLIESLARFSYTAHELIVIDNSTSREKVLLPHVHQFFMHDNIGHGNGLNMGVAKAVELFPRHSFVMFVDVDCHFLKSQWETPFLMMMKDYDVIGGRGVSSKPIRPACMFMKQSIAKKYDWSDTPGYKGHRITPNGFDVAIKAYYKIMVDNYRIGFLEAKPNRYGTANGEEWCINDTPLVYHHWHGTHLVERQVDFPDINLLEDKSLLFSKIPWRLP